MIRAALAGLALGLGLLAAVAGEPRPPAAAALAVAEAVERGEGKLHVLELARRIRAGSASLELVDLRAEAAFRRLQLPGAVRRSLPDLLEASPDARRILVVYAGPGPAAAQAWVLLRSRGHQRVYYLEDGVSAWLAGVMSPVLPADATPAERNAWPEVAELSRFFGGQPVTGGVRPTDGRLAWRDDPAGVGRDEPMVLRARRRGCGL
jgi:rhodanese-related sulfurtransferase